MKGDEVIGSYFIYNLAELNDKWEDYKPVEPLIKDEKIRKAVRTWAEASGITKVNCGNITNIPKKVPDLTSMIVRVLWIV